MNESIRQMIDEAKRQGYAVWAPVEITTFFWIADGTRIGYCQDNGPFRAPTFTTVHKPCKHAGTGYHAASMEKALEHRPGWASQDEEIIKYKTTEEFISKHWEPLIQY